MKTSNEIITNFSNLYEEKGGLVFFTNEKIILENFIKNNKNTEAAKYIEVLIGEDLMDFLRAYNYNAFSCNFYFNELMKNPDHYSDTLRMLDFYPDFNIDYFEQFLNEKELEAFENILSFIEDVHDRTAI